MARITRKLKDIRDQIVHKATEDHPDLIQDELALIFNMTRQQISNIQAKFKKEQNN